MVFTFQLLVSFIAGVYAMFAVVYFATKSQQRGRRGGSGEDASNYGLRVGGKEVDGPKSADRVYLV